MWTPWNKRIRNIEATLGQLDYHFADRHQFEKLQDLVCDHEWKERGLSKDHWTEVECSKCGRVQALSCQHGGSVACQECVTNFVKASELYHTAIAETKGNES